MGGGSGIRFADPLAAGRMHGAEAMASCSGSVDGLGHGAISSCARRHELLLK